jgi:origin recognition complex subunit 5
MLAQAIAQRIISQFPSMSDDSEPGPYYPTLKALYSHFVSVLCDVCFPFTHDPQELEYIAAARWPGFVQPVLDEHKRKTASQEHPALDQDGVNAEMSNKELALLPPSEDVRLRLSRIFNSSLSAAMEVLYPRLTTASDWALDNHPEPDLLAKHPGEVLKRTSTSLIPDRDEGMKSLPRMSKFILVAAFLASTNPTKSDLRMFGRGLDEKKRKRRATKAMGKTKSGPVKVRRLLICAYLVF